MMSRFATTFAALLLAQSAAAATLVAEELQVYDEVGETLTYSFDALPDATNQIALLGIRTGGSAKGRPGIDVGISSTEFFDITVNGVGFGRWGCGSEKTMNPIPGFTVNSVADCAFDFTLDDNEDGVSLTSLLAGGLTIELDFARTVGAADDLDEVIVSIVYEPVPPVVPLPASGWLMVAALGGLVAQRKLSARKPD